MALRPPPPRPELNLAAGPPVVSSEKQRLRLAEPPEVVKMPNSTLDVRSRTHSCSLPALTVVAVLRRQVGSLQPQATLEPGRGGAHWIAGSSAVAPGASARARL